MTDKSSRGLLAVSDPKFPVAVEMRAAADGTGGEQFILTGYASTTEQPYEMHDQYGSYSEVISRGAFHKTLAEGPKVQLLVNHGGLSLAQTTNDSLKLTPDDTGLHVEATLNPKRGDARDLIEALRDGAVDEMSFAFRVVRQQWSPDYDERRIDEVNLNRGDVSVVNLGANPATSVAMRSADIFRALEHMNADDLDELRRRLAPRIPSQRMSLLEMEHLLTA